MKKIELTIPDDLFNNLSPDAQVTLIEQTAKYCEEVVKEAGNVESILHADGTRTEITSSIIIRAIARQKIHVKKKVSKKSVIIKSVAALSALFAGGLFDVDDFKENTLRLFGFLLVFAIACLSNIMLFVDEDKEA